MNIRTGFIAIGIVMLNVLNANAFGYQSIEVDKPLNLRNVPLKLISKKTEKCLSIYSFRDQSCMFDRLNCCCDSYTGIVQYIQYYKKNWMSPSAMMQSLGKSKILIGTKKTSGLPSLICYIPSRRTLYIYSDNEPISVSIGNKDFEKVVLSNKFDYKGPANKAATAVGLARKHI